MHHWSVFIKSASEAFFECCPFAGLELSDAEYTNHQQHHQGDACTCALGIEPHRLVFRGFELESCHGWRLCTRVWAPAVLRELKGVGLAVVGADAWVMGHLHSQLLSPLTEGFLPAFLPFLGHQWSGFQADAIAMGDATADRFEVIGLKPHRFEGGQEVEQHVGREANLGGSDRQHPRFTRRLGVESRDHVMNVVRRRDPLREPEGVGAGVAWAEKVGVVVKVADHGRIGVAQAPLRQLEKFIHVGLEGWVSLLQKVAATG